MAKNYCTLIPSKGAKTFNALKKQFGYKTARSVFLKAINPKFISDFKDSLSLDAEGVPTYESIMQNSYMRGFIGDEQTLKALNANYSALEDTRENYTTALESAYRFNTDPGNSKYVATVDHLGDGKIGVVIHTKSQELVDRFNDEYSAQRLNERLAEMFEPIGITIDNLTEAEVKAGRVGHVNFRLATEAAKGSAAMIRVANNMEGQQAISEEYSHMLVGIFKDSPLVARSIAMLKDNEAAIDNILGDEAEAVKQYYTNENGEIDWESVAEEAVGHILKENLTKQSNAMDAPQPSFFRRLVNWLVNKFKGFDATEVEQAIIDVDSSMSALAKKIMSGHLKVTKESVAAAQRDADFNRLAAQIDHDMAILKEHAIKIEAKRAKITSIDSVRTRALANIEELREYLDPGADTLEGIYKYADSALQELRELEHQFDTLERLTPRQVFAFLRRVRAYIKSYSGFIREVHDAMMVDPELSSYTVAGTELSIRDIIAQLDHMSTHLGRKFSSVAFQSFAEFLRPFFGEEITVPFGKFKGTTMSVDTLLKEAKEDISFMDRWLDSMADSSDVLLQLFDRVVKQQKYNAQTKAMSTFRKIQALRQKAEGKGITNFDWMFEKDREGNLTGNYLSEINYGQFQRDLEALETDLNERYGENPTGDALTQKLAEREAWLSANAISVFGTPRPNPDVYRNPDYVGLDSDRQEILREYLELKRVQDAMYPENKTSLLKAIQIRKSAAQRILDSKSPKKAWENLKEVVLDTFTERVDDDATFGGSRTTRAIADFEGNEYMVQPTPYTTRLENPNELSTDPFGALMAYTYATCTYEAMDKVVDALEVGKIITMEDRKVNQTAGDRRLLERYNVGDIEVINPLRKSKDYISEKLQDFMEAQVYGRYLKPGGEVFGVNVNKTVGFFLHLGSLVELGFNFLSQIANVGTGLAMQNIEAAAGQFFGVKELAMADKKYTTSLTDFLKELGSRVKTNKLSLVYELLDIKQEFGQNAKNAGQKKNWFLRFFGEGLFHLGQTAGDHWLYGRTAIAMMLREKVLLNGEEMSLWDALQVRQIEGTETAELNASEIMALDGTPFNFFKFKEKVKDVNQRCFGIYNEEDQNAANRIALGRCLQHYRKWMKVQFNARFQATQYNTATESWEEGYFMTFGRLLSDLVRGRNRALLHWGQLEEEERQNLRRCLMEVTQFFAAWVLMNCFEWFNDKDRKNRPWVTKLAEYAARRLHHELGGLVPWTTMPSELLKTFKSPLPVLNTVEDLYNLINSAFNPFDYMDEIQSGPYKGLSTFEKNFLKAPIPFISPFKQINKFTGDIDTSIQYYRRGY